MKKKGKRKEKETEKKKRMRRRWRRRERGGGEGKKQVDEETFQDFIERTEIYFLLIWPIPRELVRPQTTDFDNRECRSSERCLSTWSHKVSGLNDPTQAIYTLDVFEPPIHRKRTLDSTEKQ